MADGFSSPIDLGLASTPGAGIPDEIYSEFERIYNALKILQEKLGNASGLSVLDPNNFLNSLQPAFSDSLIIQRMTPIRVQTSVALNAGDMVNLHNVAGSLRVRKADASGMGTRCHGFVNQAYLIATQAIVFMWNGYLGGAGLVPATTYYLSATTPGGITAVAPAVVGMIRQEIGVGLSASDLAVRLSTPIQL